MRRLLLAAAVIAATAVPVAGADSWSAAVKRGDYVSAGTLLQRAVFEHPRTTAPDPAARLQLARLYSQGHGVPRDPVLACGLVRAHAAASADGTPAARKAAAALVARYCAALPAPQRAAAAAAATCPPLGMPLGTTIALAPEWALQFNGRSALITRGGERREQPLPDGLLCHAQVLNVRHTPLTPHVQADVVRASRQAATVRHVIELVTVQSAWRDGALRREIVWQLFEVHGLSLDLGAVQRWDEPGSAWPAPPLPGALARGAAFTVRPSGEIDYAITDAPVRRGTVVPPVQRLAAREP